MQVFENDPYHILLEHYLELGGQKPTIYWDDINKDPNDPVYGETIFCDDGEIQIFIDYNLPMVATIETLSHELAHALVGFEHEHDEVFEAAFEESFQYYMKTAENED